MLCIIDYVTQAMLASVSDISVSETHLKKVLCEQIARAKAYLFKFRISLSAYVLAAICSKWYNRDFVRVFYQIKSYHKVECFMPQFEFYECSLLSE